MARGPEEVFAEAQKARLRDDLPAFFRWFDRKDQLRLGGYALMGLLGEEPRVAAAFGALREKHAISRKGVDMLQALGRQLIASAQRVLALSPEARNKASSEHKVLVRRHEQGRKALLESIRDLPAFLADAEVTYRQVHGGGIVSSTLFVGEGLEQVAVEGNRAWGTRVGVSSAGKRWTEDLAFVRDRSGEWRIRLLARRPGARRKSG